MDSFSTLAYLFLLHFFALSKVEKCTQFIKNQPKELQYSSNPVLDGWYADPEGVVYGDTYWIFPTYSDYYENQIFFNAFSSPYQLNWTKHIHIPVGSAFGPTWVLHEP